MLEAHSPFKAKKKKVSKLQDYTAPEATVDPEYPFVTWCEDNRALIEQYRDCHLAISPSQGIIAMGRTDDEFGDALRALGDNVPDDVILTHAAAILNRPISTMVH